MKKYLFLLFTIVGLFWSANTASAATVNYYVDPTGTDDLSHGSGSGTDAWATIQYAISNVSNPATDIIIINLAAATYTTNNDDIAVNRSFADLTLQGVDAQTTIVQSHATASSSTVEVFDIESGNNVTFENLTIRNGFTTTAGAAIQAGSGALTIRDCIIYNNDATGSMDSGGITGNGNLTIENSTFYDNDADYAAAVYYSGGTIVITNSTFYDNDTVNYMSLYFNAVNSVTITNTLMTEGSSLLLQGDFDLYLKNSILADSQNNYDLEYYNYYGVVYAENTIIGSEDTDGDAPFIANGINGNIDIDNAELSTINLKGELSGNNSTNKTLTLAVEAGSQVINAGSATANNGVSIPSTDQRGRSRLSTVDIGPFEYQGTDSADPLMTTATIDTNNTYVDINFDEGVYGTNGGSGGLEASDLSVALTQGVGEVTNVTITSVTKTDFGALTGGETTVRANISLTGTARGVETIAFSPASNTSIFDVAGNSMSASQVTNTVVLDGAFQYYVDPTGTDDVSHGGGTGTDAWATIEYAINNISNPTIAPSILNISGNTYTTNNDVISINRSFTDLTLRGAGATSTIVQPHADSASSTTRVFTISSGNNVVFEDMTIRYGRITSGSGAGVQAGSGATTYRRCTIYDNDASTSMNSGGISGSGNLTIEYSTFYNNDAPYSAAAYYSGGNIVISNSTFYNNDSSVYGMALYFNGVTSFTIVNSMMTAGSALLLQGNYNAYIKNSIIADGAGYDIEYYNYYGIVYAENTIIGVEDTDGAAPYITNGVDGNIDINDGTLASINISSSLADNGTIYGTQTLALQAGSSAINGGELGTYNGVTIPILDQRGAARSGAIDIGPYEYEGTVGAPATTTLYPADDATGVDTATNLVITFNKIVDAESGYITLRKADDTLVEAFDVTSEITGSGTTTIVINPTSSLNGLTSYYVQIDSTAFDDVSSNSYAGISDETSWTFTTGDTSNPNVDTLSPLDDATSISTNSNLVITFDEAVDTESGNITIKKTLDNSIFETIDVTSGNVTGTGTATITVNPTSNFASSTGYYVLIDTTAFDDASGNSYAGISSTTGWSFTTADEIAPTINSISSSKQDGAYKVGEIIDIDVTFSEAVTSTGSVTVTLETGDIDRTCNFSVSNSATGTCDYTVQTGDTTLDLNATISGTIADQSSNPLSVYTPTITLATNKAIIIDTTNPLANVGSDQLKKNQFTQDATTSDATSGIASYTWSKVSGPGTITFGTETSEDTTVSASTDGVYVIRLTILDNAGNSNTDDFTLTWDSTPPTITSMSSNTANGYYNGGDTIDIDIVFSEAVTSDNVTVTLETGITDRTCTIAPTNALTGTCNYTVQTGDTSLDLEATISGTILDQAGNAILNYSPTTSLATNKVLIIDTTAPSVSTLSPADDSTGIAVDANLVLTFQEAVIKGTGNIVIKTGATTTETIDVTSELVSGDGTTTITINPISNLNLETAYYVQIASGAFVDAAGNNYSGISDTTTWVFTTDETPPVLSNITTTSITNSGATITWTTDAEASSRVTYGFTSSVSSSQTTVEIDTSPRVTSHAVTLSSLVACTTYYFQPKSARETSTLATGTTSSFTTTGCTSNADVITQTVDEEVIPTATGGTVQLKDVDSNGVTITIPTNYNEADSYFQIIQLDDSTVITSVPVPSGYLNVDNFIYEFNALAGIDTEVTTFDSDLTVTMEYDDPDISGITETSLQIFYSNGETWTGLTGCIVDTDANTVTCNTNHFSSYGLFGTPIPAATVTQSGGGIILPIKNKKSQEFKQNDEIPSVCIDLDESDWEFSYITELLKSSSYPVIETSSGDYCGTERELSRGELVEWITTIQYPEQVKNFDKTKIESTPFTDINYNHKYISHIITAHKFGIIDGYIDGTFKPDNTINRAELLKILIGEYRGLRATDEKLSILKAKYPEKKPSLLFEDIKDENAWFFTYLYYAASKDIIVGRAYKVNDTEMRRADMSFPVSFGEAAKILYMLINE